MSQLLTFMLVGVLGMAFCFWRIRRQRGENCALWIGASGLFGGLIGYSASSLLVMAVLP